MDKKLDFKSNQLSYYTAGKKNNPCLLFLHGYLETGMIWKNFIPLLTNEFYIICPDIPGHGNSGVFAEIHEMNNLALAIDEIVKEEEIGKFHIIGHSMGGYLALAYRKIFPAKLISCTLFHSTCFPDTEEKKKNRDREIDFIKKGKKELIFNTNIPKAFADDNLVNMSADIEIAKEIGRTNDDEGIISLLRGMKSRADHTLLMKEAEVPYLLIAGKKDNYIPFEVMEKIQKLGTNIELKTLENSGHMGFMEEPQKSAEILRDFVKSV
jgi:pimeloyl-ACP methyl ester carboxylesterase